MKSTLVMLLFAVACATPREQTASIVCDFLAECGPHVASHAECVASMRQVVNANPHKCEAAIAEADCMTPNIPHDCMGVQL